MRKARDTRGSTLGLIVIFSLVLAVIGYGAFRLCMMFGGAHEVRNAIDAGALKVGQEVFEDNRYKVELTNADEQKFADVADKDGKIGLGNINRVWGKTLLVSMNAKAMDNAGISRGINSNVEDKLYDAAWNINSKLVTKLRNPANNMDSFNEIADKNVVNMLGGMPAIKPGSSDGFKTSYLDRKAVSNILFDNAQLPLNQNFVPVTGLANDLKLAVGRDQRTYLAGYDPMTIGSGHKFCFVPFKDAEKTHLVSSSTFGDGKVETVQAGQTAGVAVAHNDKSGTQTGGPAFMSPNSFSVKGEAKSGQKEGQAAMSFVIANPQRTFDLRLRHGFIRVKLTENTINWHPNLTNNIPVLSNLFKSVSSGNYSYKSQTVKPPAPWNLTGFPCGAGSLMCSAKVGSEFSANLKDVMFAFPGNSNGYGNVKKVLLQRINEMKPGFTAAQLDQLIDQPLQLGASKYEYIIYVSASDVVVMEPVNQISLSWLAPLLVSQPETPANQAQQVASEDYSGTPTQSGTPVKGKPVGPGKIDFPDWLHKTGKFKWRPGTGYNGCLGELSVERTTEAHVNGVCTGATPSDGGILDAIGL